MSCEAYRKVHEYMDERQINAMHKLWQSSINHDGHAWATFSDIEECVAELLHKIVPEETHIYDAHPQKLVLCPECLSTFTTRNGDIVNYCNNCGQAIVKAVEE